MAVISNDLNEVITVNPQILTFHEFLLFPFDSGWYDVVRIRVDPKVSHSCLNNFDSN